jgi:hypothetical protein
VRRTEVPPSQDLGVVLLGLVLLAKSPRALYGAPGMRCSSAPPVAALSACNIPQDTDPSHIEQRLVDLVQVQPRLAERKSKVFHDHHVQRVRHVYPLVRPLLHVYPLVRPHRVYGRVHQQQQFFVQSVRGSGAVGAL